MGSDATDVAKLMSAKIQNEPRLEYNAKLPGSDWVAKLGKDDYSLIPDPEKEVPKRKEVGPQLAVAIPPAPVCL